LSFAVVPLFVFSFVNLERIPNYGVVSAIIPLLLYYGPAITSMVCLSYGVDAAYRKLVLIPELRRRQQMVDEALSRLQERHAAWVEEWGGLEHFRNAGYVKRILEELSKSEK